MIPVAWQLLHLRTLAHRRPKLKAQDMLEVVRATCPNCKLGRDLTVAEFLDALALYGGYKPQKNRRVGMLILMRAMKELMHAYHAVVAVELRKNVPYP